MAKLISPLPIYQFYAVCMDASLPSFTPNEWVEKNRLYKIKYFTESFNVDDVALTITNKDDVEIHPSPSMWAFKCSRFKIIEVCLN